jgi:hypothetical protein
MRACLYNTIEKVDAAFNDFKEAKRLNHKNPVIDIKYQIAKEGANSFFETIKEIATNNESSQDTDLQLLKFEHDLNSGLENHYRDFSHLSNEELYDATLALAIHYILTLWGKIEGLKNDTILGILCYNVAVVFSKFHSTLNQYEFFIDLTLYSKSEIEK